MALAIVDAGLLDSTGRRVRTYAIPPGQPPEMTPAMQTIQWTPSTALQLGNVSIPNLW